MVCMMIVPAVMRAAASAAANQIDPASKGQAFSLPLRLVGSADPTHWYCGPNLVDEEVIESIRSLVQSPMFSGGIYHECPPDNVRAEFLQLLAANGLEEVPPQE